MPHSVCDRNAFMRCVTINSLYDVAVPCHVCCDCVSLTVLKCKCEINPAIRRHRLGRRSKTVLKIQPLGGGPGHHVGGCPNFTQVFKVGNYSRVFRSRNRAGTFCQGRIRVSNPKIKGPHPALMPNVFCCVSTVEVGQCSLDDCMKSVVVQPSDKMSSGNPKFLEFRYCFIDDNLRKNAIVFTIDLIKPIRFSRVASFTKFLSCGQLFNRRSRCIFRYLKKDFFVQYSKSRPSFIYCDGKMIVR